MYNLHKLKVIYMVDFHHESCAFVVNDA